MIGQAREKIKSILGADRSDLFLVIIIILVALVAFAMGRISALREQKFPVEISGASVIQSSNSPDASKMGEVGSTDIVGSKNGSVYHLANCPGAKQIKEENKIHFTSKEDAAIAGYRPAANCPGL